MTATFSAMQAFKPLPFSTAPRPTDRLRNALFGVVSRDKRPPLTSILIPQTSGPRIIWRDHLVHELAALHITRLFIAWERAGLLPFVLSVDRTYVARFSPDGRPLTHSHGNAFDINSRWNPLDGPQATEGSDGHIPHALLDIARRSGFWCGSDWRTPTNKHFELTQL